MQDYKKLVVWQKSHQLVLLVYKLTVSFPKEERYSMISQLRRSSISIPTNIAEGCGKSTARDFVSFLQIALGSTQEVEYLSFLSCELGYTDQIMYKKMSRDIGELKAMLISLIKKVRPK
jgi:four helix bundle protein